MPSGRILKFHFSSTLKMEEAGSSKTDIERKPVVSHDSISPAGNEVSEKWSPNPIIRLKRKTWHSAGRWLVL
jgi:hypothetical protein